MIVGLTDPDTPDDFRADAVLASFYILLSKFVRHTFGETDRDICVA